MKTFFSLAEISAVSKPVSLAVGVFDGFHRGHRKVVALAEESAAQIQGETWLLTFEPNPIQVLRPDSTPPRLITAEVRRHLAQEHGLDAYIEQPFTAEFSHLSPDAFVEELLRRIPTIEAIAVGSNWRFGFQASGDVSRLKELGARFGFRVDAATPVLHGGAPISSTRIRQALLAGEVAEAREMLGRCYTVEGEVIRGRQTGRRLGFPTANVAVENEVLPPGGIYAVWVGLNGQRMPGAGYRGQSNPGDTPMIEVHLLDFQGDLYGHRLTVEFQDRQREDRRFTSEAALVEQISHDVAAIRSRLASTCTA